VHSNSDADFELQIIHLIKLIMMVLLHIEIFINLYNLN